MKYDDLTMRECRYLIKQKCGELNDILNPFSAEDEWHRRADILQDLTALSARLRLAMKEELGAK